MKKILLNLIIIFLIAFNLWSCFKKEETKKIEKPYWEITVFIKNDLTSKQKEELKQLLNKRKREQANIKNIIFASNSTNTAKYKKIKEKRDKIEKELEKFIKQDQLDNFKKYCDNIDKKIREKLHIINN